MLGKLTGSPGVPGNPGNPGGPCQEENNNNNQSEDVKVFMTSLTLFETRWTSAGQVWYYNLKSFSVETF